MGLSVVGSPRAFVTTHSLAVLMLANPFTTSPPMASCSRKLIWLILLACGCAGKSYNVANPVVGPAPPRIIPAEKFAESERKPAGTVQLVSFTESPTAAILMTDVVARVNGKPVLAGDILEPYAAKLELAKPQMSAIEFRQTQEMLLKKDLDRYVEQTLMAEAVKGKLKPEQLEAIDKQLDDFFHLQVQAMMQQSHSATLMDLEGQLQEQGMSLATMRKLFGDRQLASEYVKQRVGDPPPFSPEQLKADYDAHLADYTDPAQVKWQQLQVSTNRPGGKDAAFQVLQQATQELQSGTDFDDVIKKYSDGPLAKNGGHWDWMQPDSIANEKVRTVLAELPVDEISDVLVSDSSLQLVRVTGRRKTRYTPFEEVQDDIRKRLLQEWREARAKEVITELREKSVIETMFDDSAKTS